jgi:DNA-directed RNA polymerase subunit L
MFKNLNKSKLPHGRFSFEIHDLDLSIINGLRRVIITDIPVIGFSGEEEPSIQIISNTTPLHNEFLLHRIGLIPIHFSEEETENFVDSPEFELDVENAGNSTSLLNVTTENFRVRKDNKELNAKQYFPANSFTKAHILITRLHPSEKLHVKGGVIKRTARFHAGFSPVSLCAFSFMGPSVEGSPLDKERAYYKNEFGDPTQVLFSIETEMALSPQYLVRKALEIIIDKVGKFKTSETAVTPNRLDHGVEFHIKDEDDTLGNLLQSHMHNYFIREKHQTAKNHTITFAGYFCPHPLETSVVVKVCAADHENVSDVDYIDCMQESCDRVTIELQRVLDAWKNVTGL